MKKVFLSIIFIPYIIFGQELNDERTGFVDVLEFDNVSSESLISKTKEWLVLTYSTEQFKLILDEKDKLICKGYFEFVDTLHYVNLGGQIKKRLHLFKFFHKIIIDVKDSRMRIRFNEFEYVYYDEVFYNPYYFCESYNDSIGLYKSEYQIREKINSILSRGNKEKNELRVQQGLKTRVKLFNSIRSFHTNLQNDLISSIKNNDDEW